MRGLWLSLLFLVCSGVSELAPQASAALPGSNAQASQRHVILCGGPALRKWEDLRVEEDQHDRWWGNFIRASTIRIDEIRACLRRARGGYMDRLSPRLCGPRQRGPPALHQVDRRPGLLSAGVKLVVGQ